MITTHYHTISFQPELNDQVVAYVSQKIWGSTTAMKDYASMGVAKDGKLIGGVVFHEFRPEMGTLQLSVAGEESRWLTRKVINAAMYFSFDLVGATSVYSMVRTDNHKSLRMTAGIFTNQTLVKHGFGEGNDGVMFSMSKSEWMGSRLYRPVLKS